ncbi:MAG: hypothetical protein M0P13_02545 [Fibrobacteraceae bacterium]|nr:hypothetical protein [Fibrobacteraceae bacterium]
MPCNQTIRLDISSDDAFLPCIIEFISGSTKAAGFSESSAEQAGEETKFLFSSGLNEASGELLHIECIYDFPRLRISLLDSKGNLRGKRDVLA